MVNPSVYLNKEIHQHFSRKLSVNVLEGGGGSDTYIDVSSFLDATITTIDISQVQLDENKYATHKILGDLHTYVYTPNSFDLVICMNVLEHLEDPIAAVRNFLPATRPNGLIVVGGPNPLSLAGLITKYTPHLVHVWFYRYVHGNPNAGKPGYFPYPTTLHFSIAPNNFARFLREQGLEVIYSNIYRGEKQDLLRKKFPPLGILFNALVWMLSKLTLGRFRADLSDYHMIAKKPEQAFE